MEDPVCPLDLTTGMTWELPHLLSALEQDPSKLFNFSPETQAKLIAGAANLYFQRFPGIVPYISSEVLGALEVRFPESEGLARTGILTYLLSVYGHCPGFYEDSKVYRGSLCALTLEECCSMGKPSIAEPFLPSDVLEAEILCGRGFPRAFCIRRRLPFSELVFRAVHTGNTIALPLCTSPTDYQQLESASFDWLRMPEGLTDSSSDRREDTFGALMFLLMCCRIVRGRVAKSRVFYLIMHTVSNKLTQLRNSVALTRTVLSKCCQFFEEEQMEECLPLLRQLAREFPEAIESVSSQFPEVCRKSVQETRPRDKRPRG
ncbi:MAG: hypothetical protein ACYCOU_08145 [Sulfobacillus sp.]